MELLSVILSAVNWSDFWVSINILWQGLLAIAVVIGIIIGITYLMNAISRKRECKNKTKKKIKTTVLPAIVTADLVNVSFLSRALTRKQTKS